MELGIENVVELDELSASECSIASLVPVVKQLPGQFTELFADASCSSMRTLSKGFEVSLQIRPAPLPKMAKAASHAELTQAFKDHLAETNVQVERLEKTFKKLGVSPKGKTCQAMEGLLEEVKDVMAEDAEPAVLDAALIAAAQRVEHYEIAGYGCVRTFARLLGYDEAADLLQETLDEEGTADKKLTDLAESVINAEAVSPATSNK